MKIILRLIYIIFTFIMGFIVISDAQLQKVQNFYYDEVLTTLDEGEYNEYIDDTMIILGTNKYLIEPVYRFASNNSDYSFKILVVHAQTINKGEYESSLVFYIRDFETSNSNIDGISFTFKTDISNINAELLMHFKFEDKLYNGGFLEKVTIKDDHFVINDYSNGNIGLSKIKEIDLKPFMVDENDNIVKDNSFAVIKNNDNFNLEMGNEFQFVNTNGILETKNFTGNLLEYKDLEERYENTNSYKTPDLSKLKPYNSVVTNTLIIYIIVVIIFTYLTFFLAPTINKIKKIKHNKSKDID